MMNMIPPDLRIPLFTVIEPDGKLMEGEETSDRQSGDAAKLMVLYEQENLIWLRQLQSEGEQQAEAIGNLRQLLLRAALYTFARNLSDLEHRTREEVFALAEDCAQEALIAVLQKLDTFRGESRFTTWVYKFAVNKALETARRERWKDRAIDPNLEETATDEWAKDVPSQADNPGDAAIQSEIWQIIQRVICEDLTDRQRQVVKLMFFDEIPMDVVTERLHTNRNAVYKMLHDARKRIRDRLQERGFSTEEILTLFSVSIPRNDEPDFGGVC